MPNPDFPEWFAVGVVLLERDVPHRWFVRGAEIEHMRDPRGAGDYSIHITPFNPDMSINWDPDSERTIGLAELQEGYQYTGLCMTPNGTMRDAEGENPYPEPTEEEAALAAFLPSYLQTLDRTPGAPPEAVSNMARSILDAEDTRIIQELHALSTRQGPPTAGSLLDPSEDAGMFTPQTDLFAWDMRGAPPEVGDVQGGLPIINVGQDWLVDLDASIDPESQHGARVWRVFGFEGEAPRDVWLLVQQDTRQRIRVHASHLLIHGLRQNPPDTRTLRARLQGLQQKVAAEESLPRRTAYDRILDDELLGDD